MTIRDTEAYKIYSDWLSNKNNQIEQLQQKKISAKECSRLGRQEDEQFLEKLKALPEKEQRISLKSIALEHIKEQEEKAAK